MNTVVRHEPWTGEEDEDGLGDFDFGFAAFAFGLPPPAVAAAEAVDDEAPAGVGVFAGRSEDGLVDDDGRLLGAITRTRFSSPVELSLCFLEHHKRSRHIMERKERKKRKTSHRL
jgi:hypothetical protein